MPRVHKFTGFVFILVSSFFVVPKELVHELLSHDHSTDVCADFGENPAVGNEHHHCDFLQLSLPPYTATDEVACVVDHTINRLPVLFDSYRPSFELPGCFVIRGPPSLT